MSSNTPTTTAEVRPFPNAKVAPAMKLRKRLPKPPPQVAGRRAARKKKRSARSLMLPIIGARPAERRRLVWL